MTERPTVFKYTGGRVSFILSALSRQASSSVSIFDGGVNAVQIFVNYGQVAIDDTTYQIITGLADVTGETTGSEYILN
jgi:hypothetical protein